LTRINEQFAIVRNEINSELVYSYKGLQFFLRFFAHQTIIIMFK